MARAARNRDQRGLLAAAILSSFFVSTSAFTCDVSGGSATNNATSKYVGCYNDSSVSILSSAKVSTIAMTPAYCANFCGERGFQYAGVEFGTQCFCGESPNFSDANKVNNSLCNSICVTEPSEFCGATYIMSLYEVLNPATVAKGSAAQGYTPACQTSPLCSHPICDTSLTVSARIASLVQSFTLEEKLLNLVDASAGSARLGLPSYEWWSEATHGIGAAPGVQFTDKPANFSYATSFPAPILSSAAFDDDLTLQIGRVVGREGRAFGNFGFAGFDFWAPNMNPFRDPRWGRGQETPGEDILRVQNYVKSYVPGLQGDSVEQKQVIATCKHYAAYDVETGRYGNDYDPTQQDLADYFLAPFKTCIKDVNVGSVMCSYNAVDGVPSCASEYLLEDVLRQHWNFTADHQYVVSDCSAVTFIWQYHNYTDTEEAAASVAINAGTDLECGSSYLKLNESLADGQTTIARVDGALTRLYNALFTVGFFDGGPYDTLGWSDVATPDAQALAYLAAVEGTTLLKNSDGFLPLLSNTHRKIAVIGPLANSTTQLQGDYSGTPKYIRSPLSAFQSVEAWDVTYAMGADIATNSTAGFKASIAAAKEADLVIYVGGIDNSQESETLDRTILTWPGNQLDLIDELAAVKPVIVVQLGGGQVDDTPLLNNANVKSLLWAGYPSQDAGPALLDVLTGKQSVAGRLPVTQYPASYADEVSIFDINLRPNGTYPGRTYRWYTGKAVLPFGYGLHYTTFKYHWTRTLKHQYNIQQLVDECGSPGAVISETTPFATVSIDVTNTGHHASDYVGLLFLSSPNAGPAPQPIKTLVSYSRLHNIAVGGKQTLQLQLTLGSLARADENGATTIWPGDYELKLDVDAALTFRFSLYGEPVVIDTLPKPRPVNATVPVHIQPPSMQAYS